MTTPTPVRRADAGDTWTSARVRLEGGNTWGR
jgi:hypothetical protein